MARASEKQVSACRISSSPSTCAAVMSRAGAPSATSRRLSREKAATEAGKAKSA